jgi:hypothetical protein
MQNLKQGKPKIPGPTPKVESKIVLQVGEKLFEQGSELTSIY